MNDSQKEAIVKLAWTVEQLAAMLYHELGELRYKEIIEEVKQVKSIMRE